MSWKPIDSIPRTESDFLVYCSRNKAVYQATWSLGWDGEQAYDDLISVPDGTVISGKYWMDIPELPE